MKKILFGIAVILFGIACLVSGVVWHADFLSAVGVLASFVGINFAVWGMIEKNK